ncbi:MAG: FAD binding domain-containing protein [Verrucomicrobiales bacterium]
MQSDFEFSINGNPHRGGGTPTQWGLLDYLRGNRITSAKDACDGGDCGACSVLLIDSDCRQRPVFRVVNACQLTLPMVAGREIWTAEAMSGGEEVHPLQEALSQCEQFSCGYCLPGFSMAFGEIYGNPVETRSGRPLLPAVGNICRCTGYWPLYSALNGLLREEKIPANQPQASFLPSSHDGLLPAFACRDQAGNLFYRPGTLTEALRLLQAHPDSKLVAGGSTYPASRQLPPRSKASRRVVISLESVTELRQVAREQGQWQIGAAVTIRSLSDTLAGKFPLIARMTTRFGSPQVRNRATVGGNLALAEHDSDLVPVLLALDAQVVISNLREQRKLRLEDFLGGPSRTALSRGEILRTVLLECPDSTARAQDFCHHLSGFYKVSRRHHNDRAIVCAAFLVELNEAGRVTRARLCYGGVAEQGMRAYGAEELLTGALWGPRVARRVAIALRQAFPAQSDYMATAGYRNAMAGQLWRKFFSENRTPGQYAPVDRGLGEELTPFGTGLENVEDD